jgi:hypothetical protein
VANQGQVDSATVPTQISYDGVSDYSENTLDVATFSAMSQGSIFYTSTPDGTGNVWVFTMQDASKTTSYIRVGTDANNVAVLAIRKDGGTSYVMKSTSVVTSSSIIEWKSDGNTYQCFINGIEDIVVPTSGDNEGKWFNYTPLLDGMAIGTILTTIPASFYNVDFKHLSIFSTPLTDVQSKDYANYLIQKHN